MESNHMKEKTSLDTSGFENIFLLLDTMLL